MKELKFRITFTEDILGSASSDPHLHENYIASKAPDAWSTKEEIEALGIDAVVENGKTIFQKDSDGCPIYFDYQIKGFFKESCKALSKVPGTLSSKLKAYKQQIDLRIFPAPRKIRITEVGRRYDLQRPLRASTPMGERIALANSETIRAGASIEFTVKLLVDTDADLVREWLDYGALHGMGQWRNAGYGRFTWEEIA